MSFLDVEGLHDKDMLIYDDDAEERVLQGPDEDMMPEGGDEDVPTPGQGCLVLSCLLTLYTAVMSFEILFPFEEEEQEEKGELERRAETLEIGTCTRRRSGLT